MAGRKFELTEEIIQRYYDGEIHGQERSRIEEALAAEPALGERLERYGRVSKLMQLVGETSEPDDFTARRNWEQISRRLKARPRTLQRRAPYWLSLAAAAVLLLFFIGPFGEAQSNELEIESIDCTYASFMLIQPETETGHTIIWLSDSGNNGSQ